VRLPRTARSTPDAWVYSPIAWTPAAALGVSFGRSVCGALALPPAIATKNLWLLIHERLNRSSLVVRAGPAAMSLDPCPKATYGAFCATRREARVTGLDRGAGPAVSRRYASHFVAVAMCGRGGVAHLPVDDHSGADMPIYETLSAVPERDVRVTPSLRAPSDPVAVVQHADAAHNPVRWAVAAPDREAGGSRGEPATSIADAPCRSVRRATARRASRRRAVARSRHGEPETRVLEFLAQHPARTIGDLAKGLNLDAGLVAGHLSRLAATGEIERTSHGFRTTEETAPPRI